MEDLTFRCVHLWIVHQLLGALQATKTMRNLKLLLTTSWSPPEKIRSCYGVASLSVMEEMDEKFILMAHGDQIVRYSPSSESWTVLELSGEIPFCEDEKLVAVQPVFDQIIIMTSHRAFSCTADFQQFECVREFPVAVVTAVWSPNLDIVAIITADDRLTIASGSDLFDRGDPEGFDMAPDHFGRAQLVDIGWGKKATQFHGKEGKAAATRTVEHVSELAKFDSARIGLTWQSDSEMFAVSSVDSLASRRVIRWWTSDGELHATGEAVTVISPYPEGHVMAWRGSGNRVAVAARRPQPGSPPQVVFYERNGLQHRQMGCEFVVVDGDPGTWRISALAWNASVDVLAVGLEEFREEEDCAKERMMCRRIQLWTTNNRHWYRKYELTFADDVAVAMTWDPTEAYRLHVMTESDRYRSMEWSSSVSRSADAAGQSFVGVIDGARLRLSPFLGLCVPPPMAAFVLNFPSSLLQLAFSTSATGGTRIAVHLSNGSLVCLAMGEGGDGDKEIGHGVALESKCCPFALHPKSIQQLLPPGSLSDTASHLTWTPKGPVLVDNKEILLVSGRDDGGFDIIRSPVPSPDGLSCGLCAFSGHLLYQDSAGGVWRKEQEEWRNVTRFAARCDEWTVVREGLYVGLQSAMNRLMMNSVVLMTNCTSFIVHDRADFVLTSNTDNRLICIPVGRCRSVDDVVREVRLTAQHSEDAGPKGHNELVRAVERGSLIVTSVGIEAKVVLQMPRGNLEAIFPRALVLDTTRRLIDNEDYRAAYLLMRRHRVNMNLLFDHNLQHFLDHPEPLLRAINDPDDVNMVLAELCDEDLRTTLYKSYYGPMKAETSLAKVNAICERFERVLGSSLGKHLSCLVTCCAKRRPQQLTKALQLVLTEKKRGEIGEAAIEKGIRTLSYYVSTTDLYRLALGTYDFDAVLFVLNNSPLDPREHLPFLEELQGFPEDYRKFRIDVHNEKFVKAISHVLPSRDATHFEEAFQIIKQHSLFADALKLYPLDQTNSDEYKTLSRAFADRLRQEERISGLESAGQVLLRCGEAREAARCFLGAVNWKKWSAAVKLAEMEDEEVESEAKTLAATLSARGEWDAAVTVLEKFTGDGEAALNAAVSGGLWDTVLSLAHCHDLSHLLESLVRPAMIDAAEELAQRMAAVKTEFVDRVERLESVRADYARSAMEELQRSRWDDEGQGGGIGSDLYSETSSIPESLSSTSSSASRGSRSSRTSKSKRKAERKRWNLKEGSEYEEVAIMERLYQLGEQANRLKAEVVSLCSSLVDFSVVSTAYSLTKKCGDLLALMRRRRDDIWWETAKRKEGDFQRLTTEESLRLLRGETSTMKRQYPDIHEVFLKFPPNFESPPQPTSLMCPDDVEDS